MPAPSKEDRSQNPLYNRELLKGIMGQLPMEPPAAPTADPAAPATPSVPAAAPPGGSGAGHDEKTMSWSEVPAEAAKNLGPSLMGVGESMVQPIVHPLDTAAAVGKLGKGLYSKASGALGAQQDPKLKAEEESPVDAVVSFYKDRYGTEEGFKQALAKDPAGVAADFSTFLTGGGSALARAPGKLGKIGEAARYAGTAGPIGEGVQKVAETGARALTSAATTPTSAILSFTTGKPFKTLQDAAKAGFAHSPEFLRHLAGEGSADEIVNRVEGAMSSIADKRSKDYIAGMKDPTASTVQLGYGMIDKAIADATPKFTHLGKVYNQEAKNAFDKAAAKIDEWRTQPAQPGAHTIEDMDKLKRALDEIHVEYSKDYGADSPAARVVSDIRRSVFDTIKAQDPRYAEVMERYADATRQLKEMRKDLIGGRTTTVGGKMRKLLAGGKDKSHKEQLLAELEKIDPDIGYALAGHELSNLVPQGAIARIAAGTKAALVGTAAGAAAPFNPMMLAGAGAFSPAIAGLTQYGIGAAAGLPSKVPPAFPYALGEIKENESYRPKRATGGKISRGMTADMIISAVKRAHNAGKNETEDMLNLPDESVAKALDIAKRGI